MVERERRARIVKAYGLLPSGQNLTQECIYFVHQICRCRSISHFLDTAKESNVERLERMLNV